jgi:glycosyltransferase involved in cell wall biosynthesis
MPLKNLDRLGISVVLCAYNSKNRIVSTLQHLSQQKGIFFSWEILLIDNNSLDNTSGIALETWTASLSPCELRIIKEPKAGTMHARHRGIVESGYRYLLFCDDDNWFNPLYVKTAFEIIHNDPAIAAVGGCGILEFEAGFNPSEWVEKFKKTFGAGPQGKIDGDTTDGKGCLYTAGAILDRVWLERLYNFGFTSSLKGRDGKSLVAGEDTELTYALKLIGGKLFYSSQMHFKHFMPRGRITWPYVKKMWRSFGYSDFLISPYVNHFKNRRQHAFTVIILQRIIALSRSFVRAVVASFAEGNKNVLQFQRAIGEFKAAVFNYKTFLRNQQMVANLLRHIKNERK